VNAKADETLAELLSPNRNGDSPPLTNRLAGISAVIGFQRRVGDDSG